MITFWVIAAVLTVLVLLILIIPILRTTQQSTTSNNRTTLNIQLSRDRLHELERDYHQKGLDQSQYQAMKQELELSLAKDLESAPESSTEQSTPAQGKWVAWVLVLFVPIVAVSLYLNYGDLRAFDPSAQAQANTRQTGSPTQQPSAASIEKMVDGLAKRLQQEPNDPQGWMMLGRSYMVMGRYKLASNAYAQLQKLVGDDVNVLLQYAQAKVMSNNEQWDASSIAMVEKALTIEPENPVALSLTGILAARRGNRDTAISMWRKAQTTMQPNSTEYNELENMIASLSGNTTPTNTQRTTNQTASAAEKSSSKAIAQSIKVNVSITPELLTQAQSDQTIFIYAQALTGPPMPIAVVRKKVSELPVVVTLDDSMAMMPTRKLSSFDQVRIAARISQSGSAMPATGDLQGKVEPVSTATSTSVSVVIDHIL